MTNVLLDQIALILKDPRSQLILKCLTEHHPNFTDASHVLREAVDSLFVECALEDDFNSSEPWCVFEILAAIDGVMEGGPYYTDAALRNRREVYVLKAYVIVSPYKIMT